MHHYMATTVQCVSVYWLVMSLSYSLILCHVSEIYTNLQ